jgi:hypothetical protein
VTQLEDQATNATATRKAVKLVDVDIHPVMLQPEMTRRLPERWSRHLERYGRRAPFVTDLYLVAGTRVQIRDERRTTSTWAFCSV